MTSHPTPTGRAIGGKQGGIQTLKRYGKEYFKTIGRKGGKARSCTPKRA